MKLLAAALLVLASAAPAAAALPTSIECAASVTSDLGPKQTLRDLEPAFLPILAYRAVPQVKEYKPLAKFGEVPVGLYVYRVNDELVHMQVFELTAAGKGVLADTAMQGPITELTVRAPGGTNMVTAYCYW